MRGALLASILVFSATGAVMHRRSVEDPKGEYYPDRPASKVCEELCKTDSGIDADKHDCLTECATHTDLQTHHINDGYDGFATDEAYNEKGGKKMEEKAEADHPVDVLDCAPQVDIDHAPKLTEIDTKQDGVIDQDEARTWGHKACVPDEMTDQIFSEADVNQDKVISSEEYEASGEGTAHEEAVDKALEEHSEGDDEYNKVQAPPLEEFDENDDGGLDKEEHEDAVKFEMERRGEGRWSVSDDEVPEGATKEAFDKVDTDGDGKIEGDEYTEAAADGGSDFGEEINEAAAADEDAADPDDLERADGTAAAPAAAASMLSTRFKVAQRNEAAFLRRFNSPKKGHASQRRSHRSMGHAFVELARLHQAKRHQKHKHASFRRHHAF